MGWQWPAAESWALSAAVHAWGLLKEVCYLHHPHRSLFSGETTGSFPRSSVSKESACIAGDLGLIPGLERSPGEGNGNPLQYPCLENPMDRGALWAAVQEVTKS